MQMLRSTSVTPQPLQIVVQQQQKQQEQSQQKLQRQLPSHQQQQKQPFKGRTYIANVAQITIRENEIPERDIEASVQDNRAHTGCELLRALRPLRQSMRCVGLYFDRDVRSINRDGDNYTNDDVNDSDKEADNDYSLPSSKPEFQEDNDGNAKNIKNKNLQKSKENSKANNITDNNIENKNTNKKMVMYRCFGSSSKIYSSLVLIAMWVNLARTPTFYTQDDTSILPILMKTVSITYVLTCTLFYTTYYRTSCAGRLDRTLRDIVLASDQSRPAFPSLFWISLFTVNAWLIVIGNTLFFIYMLFLEETHSFYFLLGPFYSHIAVDPRSSVFFIIRITELILNFYESAAWAFGATATFAVALVFALQFRACNADIRAVIRQYAEDRASRDSPPRDRKLSDVRFAMEIERLRVRHQRISRAVNRTDKYLTFYMGAAVVGDIAQFVLVLYLAIFLPDKEPLTTLIFFTWIVVVGVHMVITAASGVIVKNAAHKIFDRVHDIDLSSLDAKTIGRVNIFLKRLSGEPIGFSVLRIFVIDRNTILTILGSLITYFLLVVQLSSSGCSYTTSSSAANVTTNATNTN